MPIQSSNPPQIVTIEDWVKGINQQSRRGSIDDQEQWWCENLFPLDKGNLRACYGPSDAIYTAPSGVKIVRMFFGFIGYPTPQFAAPGPANGGRLGWMFLSDGNIDQVDLDLKTVTRIGQIWEPIPPYYWGSAVVWRPRFFGSVLGQNGGVLFGSPKGYYAWDGQTLSSPGDPAPDWLTDLQETAPSDPIPQMPVGLPGIYAMEVYQSRMFVAGKDVISFSAPSNGADFSTNKGGGSLGYFGNKLTYSYVDLAASAGFLYCFGDSSTDVIGNIETIGDGSAGNPITTNFDYANLDPQVGCRFPRPVGRFGRYPVMFNGAGIFTIQGGFAEEIGHKITNIWNTLDTSISMPTFATATMFGFRVVLANGRFTDPWGVTRNLILMWHPLEKGAFWTVASQNIELTQIGSYEQDSVITPYGTDGTSLYQLFAKPDPKLLKQLSTKALRGADQQQLAIKNFKRLYLEVYDNSVEAGPGDTSSLPAGVSLTGNVISGGGDVPGGSQAIGFDVTRGAIPGYHSQKMAAVLGTPLAGAGIWAAIDLQSYSTDFTIERVHLAFEDMVGYGA
jgi:hypothetical protein